MTCTADDGRFKVSGTQIISALRTHCGILTYAAKELDISRTTLYRWLKLCPELKIVRDRFRHRLFEFSEELLEIALEHREPWATKFALETLGRADEFWEPVVPPEYEQAPLPAPRKTKKSRKQAATEAVADGATAEPLGAEDLGDRMLNDKRGKILDVAHRNVTWALDDNQPWAIKYCLRTFGAAYGYGTRHRPFPASATLPANPPSTPGEATEAEPVDPELVNVLELLAEELLPASHRKVSDAALSGASPDACLVAESATDCAAAPVETFSETCAENENNTTEPAESGANASASAQRPADLVPEGLTPDVGSARGAQLCFSPTCGAQTRGTQTRLEESARNGEPRHAFASATDVAPIPASAPSHELTGATFVEPSSFDPEQADPHATGAPTCLAGAQRPDWPNLQPARLY